MGELMLFGRYPFNCHSKKQKTYVSVPLELGLVAFGRFELRFRALPAHIPLSCLAPLAVLEI